MSLVDTPRTIAFSCELLHPPQPVDPAPLQRVHNRMFETGHPTYKSFGVASDGVTLANPQATAGAVSSVAFAADRITFREELSGLTTEEFSTRVTELFALAGAARGIQIVLAQIVTVRTLVVPRRFKDARVFLREGVLKLGGEMESFGREPQLYGLRLVFPPTREQPNAFSLRIESFPSDVRAVFVENQASFGALIPARGLEPLAQNVQATYAFVVERAVSFLARFDARQEV